MKKLYLLLFLSLPCFLISSNAYSQTGISFDGVNDYVTLGSATGLGSAQFTLEVWFKREGTGIAVQTDTNGVVAFPLISKGRMEGEGNNLDMNYFLGIDAVSNTICGDFEEGSGQAEPGKNHPIRGTTSICNFRWYHAAITYDGSILTLYLNGVSETSIVLNVLSQSASLQHTSLGTTLNSSGVASGFFNGRLDEARIWNYARTPVQINTSYNLEITSAAGLQGRWGLNDGAGNVCINTGSVPLANGALMNGATWVTGTPFSVPGAQANYGLALQGTNSYISFGNNLTLGLTQFTLETWFMRQGIGSVTTSGSGGVLAVPLIAKGRGESDGNNRDMNYFLGIDTATGFLVADFEEAIGERNPGRNHPVYGATSIQYNIWYHAAVTYDGATWNLYLNGNLENQLFIGQLPQNLSIQHASIGSALNSVGTPEGFFNGILDEVRIWNISRTQLEIRSTMNIPISTGASGLKARWGMNEACGTNIADSSGNGIHSFVQNKNWYWAQGCSFDLPVAIDQPTQSTPSDQAGNIYLNSELSVNVNDAEGKNLTVTYFVQPCPNPAPDDFTVVGLPDTQHYVSYLFGGTNEMYKAQTNWIAQNRVSENIVFVHGLGDCVQNGDNGGNPIEWQRADTAMKLIEDPATTLLHDGIPYGLNVGNHDQSPIGEVSGTTTLYNTYFGESRFTGRSYYGGHFGTKNNNNYSFFSAGGIDFIVINLEYDLNTVQGAVAQWLRGLLTLYSNHYAIIGSHYMLNGDGTFAPQGLAIYNEIKRFPNVILTQSGHVSAESRREDIYNGSKIISIMADYQSRTNGGNGWMRLLKFSPLNNTINVQTYSPWLNQFETDSNSQFTYTLNMNPRNGYSILGTNSNVPSGSISSFPLTSLLPNTCYFWYVSISNGTTTTNSPVWKFNTVTECTEITSFSPGTGAQGDTIEVKGKSFNALTDIKINTLPATFILISDTILKVIIPTGASTGRIILKGSCNDSSDTNLIVNNCSAYPASYIITGGGLYCSSPGTGSMVGLTGSQPGVDYQLYINNNPVGSIIEGNGNSLSFGNQIQTGNYTIVATDPNGCSTTMAGSTFVGSTPNPSINIQIVDSLLCFGSNALISVQGIGGSAPYTNTGNYFKPAGSYIFTISDANNCTNTGQIVLVEPPKVESIISTINSSCGSPNGSATVVASGGTPGYTYLWSEGQLTQTATNLSAGNYSVRITDSNGCTGVTTTSIINAGVLPAAAGNISGPEILCRNSVLVFSIPPVTDATTYNWTLPPGTSGTSSTNSITITFSGMFNGGFICVSGENSCGSGSSTCKNVSVLTSRPARPALIIGPEVACPLNTYTYTIGPVSSASGYTWSVNGTGATITQGQGTNSIIVSTAAGFSKATLKVFASNCVGNSNSVSMDIFGIAVHSNSLIGPTSVCPASTGISYSINPVPRATNYFWSIISGDLQVASQNGNAVTINTGTSFTTGVLAVSTINSCGSFSRSYTLRSGPPQPGGISGPYTGMCLVNNIQYNISSVSGATSYSWTVPTGVQVISVNGTVLKVNYTSGFSGTGNICVTANNSCGQSVARCLLVKSTLAAPSAISGSSAVCKSQTGVSYSITPVTGALSYLWNISGGAYILPQGNATTALADFRWSYSSQISISVSSENPCGFGTGASKTIMVNPSCRESNNSSNAFTQPLIFPNPSSGLITVQFYLENSSACKFRIENMIGQVWLENISFFTGGTNTHDFDLRTLPKGIYYLSINGDQNMIPFVRFVLN